MVRTLLIRISKKYGTQSARSLLVEPLVRIEFKGVSMQLKGSEKVLLENVSGMYNPGQMHAIMGPSGSGATSMHGVRAWRIVSCCSGLPCVALVGTAAQFCWERCCSNTHSTLS